MHGLLQLQLSGDRVVLWQLAVAQHLPMHVASGENNFCRNLPHHV
jgi:hypothetical protein